MSAYVNQLNRHLKQKLPPRTDLRSRFLDWFNSLPEVTRTRAFSMQEFERALGSQGRHISAVLLNMSWQRKRKWDSQGHYHRYWVPPV